MRIPHFKRCRRMCNQGFFESIESDGLVLHKIENLDDFYQAFGFSNEIAKQGVLPDEFIWEEYIKDSPISRTTCLQIHILEYLRDHSSAFNARYGKQIDSWIVALAKTRAREARGKTCCACKTKCHGENVS